MALCTGELEESFSSFDQNQTREDYFKRIGNKTASLFAMATEAASIVCNAPEEMIQTLRSYGYNLGMAFQIIDDILDFTATEEELGKPVASDLLQGTLTLPSIMLREKRPDVNPIKDIFENRQREQNLQLAIDMIRNSDIVPECFQVARDFIAEACRSLEVFPDSIFRQALIDIANYVIERQE